MRHVAYAAFGTATIQAANVISGILAARLLLPEGRGELAAILLWPAIIAAIGSLSLDQAIAYHGARRRESAERLCLTGLTVSALLAALAAGLGYPLIPILLEGYRDDVLSLARLYLAYIPLNYASMAILGYFQGSLGFGLWTLLRTLVPLGYLLGIALAAAMGRAEVAGFAVAALGANGAAALAAGVLLLRRLSGRDLPRWGDALRLARYAVRVHPPSVVHIANQRLDHMVVAAALSATELGYYVVAAAVAGALNLVAVTLSPLVLPKVAIQQTGGAQTLVFGRYLRTTVAVVLLGAGAVFALAWWLVPLLFGAAFAPAVPITHVLVIGTGAQAIKAVCYNGLKARDRVAPVHLGETSGLAVKAAALALLLPAFGLAGAAWAHALSQVLALAVGFWGLRGAFATDFTVLAMPGREDWTFLLSRLRSLAGRRV